MNTGTLFACGSIYMVQGQVDAEQTAYVAHPTYCGVWLKHLVTGRQTDGQVSCHLVKVEPGCALEQHTHAANLEIHEVVAGGGLGSLAGQPAEYSTGAVAVIPAGTMHSVTAGQDGLYILAKFCPALL